MSQNPSCPAVLPEGITRNSTQFQGPNATSPIFAGYVYEWDSLAPTNITMNAMLSCCSNNVYIGEHQSPFFIGDRHCGLWCEFGQGPGNMDDIETEAKPWKECASKKTNASVGWVNHAAAEDLGARLGSPTMFGLALLSLIVAAVIVG